MRMMVVSHIRTAPVLGKLLVPSLLQRLKIPHRMYVNLPKDVNIYHHNAAGFARLLGFCGLAQCAIVSFMSSVMYGNMPAFFSWIPVDKSTDKCSHTNSKRLPLADWKYRAGFTMFTFGSSFAMMVTTFMYAFRSVSSITLLRQSQKVMFTTYTPIGTLRSFTIDVRNVSAIQRRTGTVMTQIPLKLKDYQFHFLVDKSGNFPQPSLFDRTVGIKRDFGIMKK